MFAKTKHNNDDGNITKFFICFAPFTTDLGT